VAGEKINANRHLSSSANVPIGGYRGRVLPCMVKPAWAIPNQISVLCCEFQSITAFELALAARSL
jgi:hypothetical protein